MRLCPLLALAACLAMSETASGQAVDPRGSYPMRSTVTPGSAGAALASVGPRARVRLVGLARVDSLRPGHGRRVLKGALIGAGLGGFFGLYVANANRAGTVGGPGVSPAGSIALFTGTGSLLGAIVGALIK